VSARGYGVGLADTLIAPYAPRWRWRRLGHWLVQGFGLLLAVVVAPLLVVLAAVALGAAQ
jgi:hypothetical protein